MQRLTVALCGFLLLAAPAYSKDCYLYSDLAEPQVLPQLYVVSASGRLNFVANTIDNAACPARDATCIQKAYLVTGDTVVVTGSDGDYLCATYGSGRPPNATTTGWLPSSALAAQPNPAPPNWLGNWAYGDEQEIDITAAGKAGIAVSGSASWGGHDPVRVANGGVNTGEFTAGLEPEGTAISFSVSNNGETVAFDPSPDSYNCGVRLWLREPYLVARDNIYCGGNNVSFTGVYTRVK